MFVNVRRTVDERAKTNERRFLFPGSCMRDSFRITRPHRLSPSDFDICECSRTSGGEVIKSAFLAALRRARICITSRYSSRAANDASRATQTTRATQATANTASTSNTSNTSNAANSADATNSTNSTNLCYAPFSFVCHSMRKLRRARSLSSGPALSRPLTSLVSRSLRLSCTLCLWRSALSYKCKDVTHRANCSLLAD